MEKNEKQAIEEMERIIGAAIEFDELDFGMDEKTEIIAMKAAEKFYAEGYCKQIEAEWILEHETYGRNLCSNCGEEALKEYSWNDVLKGHLKYVRSNFCPNCGAHMKGGAE